MIQSMTGYASAIVEIPLSAQEKLSLSIHIKALNSRYFEILCKLPYVLTDFEIALQKLLKQKLQRGNIYLTIKIQHSTSTHEIIPNVATIRAYLQAIATIKTTCHINDELNLATLLQLPNIFQVEEEPLQKTLEPLLINQVHTIVEQLIAMRLQEGAVLKHDLLDQMLGIQAKTLKIQETSNQVLTDKKEQLDSIITAINTKNSDIKSTQDHLQEQHKMALLADLEKMDIHEELIRAQAHIAAFINYLHSAQDNYGKKLDFILQELTREINTMTAKCSDVTISSLAIDIKAALEKCREQTQNIV